MPILWAEIIIFVDLENIYHICKQPKYLNSIFDQLKLNYFYPKNNIQDYFFILSL